ncbi:MAG: class I SAM-dependent methyltransferase [Corallococcus sp.]|nr:class I SAM-dependent methyltransferase [Corallococcus sp.]
MIKLTKRQRKIVDAIGVCDVLCDVGCDHGYIGAAAKIQNLCTYVHFCDISASSLQKAQTLCGKLQLDGCDFKCQDGLQSLQCDAAVIAGMGGLEIISILSSAKTLPQRLVLQPMRNQVDLRAYLCDNYYIQSDCKFRDGKFYDLIVAQKGSDKLSKQQMLFGKTNLERITEEFTEYLTAEKHKYESIVKCSRSQQPSEYLAAINAVLDGIA